MYDFDEDEEGGRSLGRTLGIGAAVLVVAALGWFVVKPRLGGGDDGGGGAAVGGAVATTVAGTEGDVSGDATDTTVDGTSVDTSSVSPDSTAVDEQSTTASTTTTPGGATSSDPATTTTTPPPTTVAAPYETLPDGTPAPVIAVFDTNSITLTGAVPDQAAKDLLQTLAVTNAKPGQADRVDNQVTLNPAVPRNVGVRVVELTSARFPDGSAEILPPHAAELDRIVTIMNALPNVSALIIGHADQRGDNLANYAISEERALAVKNYVIAGGVAQSRLSSRAVGEEDLLTLENDPAALALNRRTEIVFYGLLL
jgi:outer membrane protein OmpA-like peptidoglycan-associated protein